MVIPRAKFSLCSGDLFDSDDFVAADLQIRQSCATILSDVHPPIIVLKSCPSRAATSRNQSRDWCYFRIRPRCFSSGVRAQHCVLFTLARMKNSLRISAHSCLEIVC